MRKIFSSGIMTLLIIASIHAQNLPLTPGIDDKLNSLKFTAYFTQASETYNIPVEILEAIGYVESHWHQRIPVENADTPTSYGIMGLRDDDYFGHSLIRAAELTETNIDSLKNNAKYNILGAAALLNMYRQQEISNGKKFSKVEDWKSVIEKFSGIPQSVWSNEYSYEVYKVLNDGIISDVVIINKIKIDSSLLVDPLKNSDQYNNPDAKLLIGYPGAVWTSAASGNFAVSSRPSSYPVNKIIIHDTEGSFASAVSWFQNASSGVSSHYIVRSSDGYVVQMVDEKDVAYHAGNLVYNQNSIGIEIEGYITDPSYFTGAVLNSVKNICAWDCNQWGFAPDRVHILGHNQVPDPNNTTLWGGAGHHSDPGGFWDWDTFIQSVSGINSTYQPLIINATSLNVRTLPGASGPLLTTVSQYQEYVSYFLDSISGWYLIFIPGGNSLHYDGWISGAYVSEDNCAPQIKVTGAWPTPLKVRSGPATSYSIIDEVTDNQIFVAYGTSSGWYNYHTPACTNATNGWSSGSYLQLNDPCNIITDIKDEPSDISLNIFPNPAKDNIIIHYPVFDSDSKTRVQIFSADGRLIKSLLIQQNNVQLNIEEFPSGIYIIKVTDDNVIAIKRLIKE